jgi:hypothetical protein
MMKTSWSLAVVLALTLSAGSLDAQSGDKLPARYSALQTALQRQAAPGIRPLQTGGCPPGLPPAISLNTTVNSSIDQFSCFEPSLSLFFDFYAVNATAGQHLHVTYTSSALRPLISFLTTAADPGTALVSALGTLSATSISLDYDVPSTEQLFVVVGTGTPLATGTYSLLVATGSGVPCSANATTLCLQSGRFSLTVAWINQHATPATTGVGTAVVDTDQTGFFWFFSAQSIELVVKIVDGRALNGKFWVFYGALSDVEYTITVTDTQTGAIKTYHNPPGNISGGADTSAFGDTPSGSTVELLETPPARFAEPESGSFQFSSPGSTPSLVPAPCTPSAEHLCLLGNRFQVSVAWINQHPPGGTGVGTTIPATDQSGYFWFFNPDSVELVVKMVDGGALNGKFWVFFGALSDVEYTITVTDTQTGLVKSYHNAPGNISGGADTSAFASSGSGGLDPAALAGTWSGTWHNIFFDTNGPITMAISVDTGAHTFSVLVTLGGNVFGGSPPPPQTFVGSYTPGGSGTFTQDSPVFGHVTATIAADGSLTGSITGLPSPQISRVDFTGTITSTTMNINYTITGSPSNPGTATGTVTLTKT